MNLVDDLSIAICEKIDIIKIVHEHGVVLEKAGNKYKGICPFHPDKKPSFIIYPETGTFYCFGCQQAGNAINFYAKKNNLSYNQAKQHLVEKLGLKRPGNNKSSSGSILQGCTLQEYAELKQIPIEHLKSFGLKETTYKEKPAILIPYMDEAGKTVSVQYRTALRKSDNTDDRFKFKKGVHVFLYGVWRIKDYSNYDYMVIVEGASDCHTLWYRDIQAVGIPGAVSWKEEWAGYLDKFESVYVWIEPDAGGKSALKAFQNSILIRKIKTISHDECKDPSELYLKDKNNFVDNFWKILTDAKPLPETENLETLKMIDDIEHKFNEIKDPGILNYPLTDCGNAERFVKLFGDKFCYVRNRGKWLNFRNVHWVDADDSVRLAVRDVARILGKTSFMADDNKQITDILKWAKASESIAKIGAALDLARCHLSHDIDEFDKNPMALTCRNGIIDLETGKLLKAEPKNFSYRFIDIDYDENAECPNFQSILRDIFCRNDELIDFIQRAIGYSLTGLTSEQCIFICYGSGANGKSTFLRCLQYIAGNYYATTPSSTFKMNFKDDRIPNDLARLFGVRLVLCSEISEGTRLHEERVKVMTGGDIISARFLHQEWFDYLPVFKIWLSTNHKPVIRGTDEAIWRRIRLIPFEAYFSEKTRVPQDAILNQITKELPVLLNFAVQGCIEWQKRGLRPIEEIESATRDYRLESDVLGRFIDERCVQIEGIRIKSSDLYKVFQDWCQENGEHEFTNTAFGRRMSERGIKKIKDGGFNFYLNLGIKN